MLLLTPAIGFGSTVKEAVEVTATATDIYGKTVTRPVTVTVTVFRDSARTRAPFMVLNYGRPAKLDDKEVVPISACRFGREALDVRIGSAWLNDGRLTGDRGVGSIE